MPLPKLSPHSYSSSVRDPAQPITALLQKLSTCLSLNTPLTIKRVQYILLPKISTHYNNSSVHDRSQNITSL
jgi:hypothetical protein